MKHIAVRLFLLFVGLYISIVGLISPMFLKNQLDKLGELKDHLDKEHN